MFDLVRKHTKLMMGVMFLLIIPSFIFFGVQGYSGLNDKSAAVAVVDGHDILQTEWDAAHQRQVEQLRQAMPSLDVAVFDSPVARYATLERLVRERLLAAAAGSQHLAVSDARLAAELQQNEVIAALRGADGQLDMGRYRQLLARQGLSPEMFEEQVRAEMAARQVLAGMQRSALTAPSVARSAFDAYLQQREVQVAVFSAAEQAARVQPTEAELQAFYKSNPQLFQAPEQATVDYVVLDLEALKKDVTVNEADLKTYYEQNAAKASGPEERRASHILLAAPAGAAPAERAQAKARAEELLAQLKKQPASFAELARKNSQDPASATRDGDLGYFTRGAMTPAFEDAVFSLKKGELSAVVESEFGYHLIWLADIKQPSVRSFDELRPELEAQLRTQQAQRKFAEVAQAFTDAVYEQPDSLKPVAERLKLEVKNAANVLRQPGPTTAGVLANPKFLNALFSADSVEKKRNTDAVEVGPNQLAAGRIVQYTPARTRPLEEVKDDVRQRVAAQRGAELARQEGAQKLAQWKAQPASATLPAAVVISRQNPQKQNRAVLEAALQADAAKLPAWVGVDLGKDGYAVVKVSRVVPRPEPTPELAKQELTQYTAWWAGAETAAYEQLLKQRYNVKMKVPQPAASQAGAAGA